VKPLRLELINIASREPLTHGPTLRAQSRGVVASLSLKPARDLGSWASTYKIENGQEKTTRQTKKTLVEHSRKLPRGTDSASSWGLNVAEAHCKLVYGASLSESPQMAFGTPNAPGGECALALIVSRGLADLGPVLPEIETFLILVVCVLPA
jgi:hypothetical protein